MNKAQLVSAVKKRLGEDGRLGDRTVAIYIGMALEQVFKDIFAKSANKINFYTRTYPDVAVQKTSTKEYYSTLPEQIIQDLDAEEGVRKIWLEDRTQLDFVPLDIDMDILEGTDVGKIMPVVGYQVKTDRVIYYNMLEDVDKVNMDLVVPFDKWDDKDEVSLPQGTHAQIIGVTIELLQGTPYIDPKRRNINVEMK